MNHNPKQYYPPMHTAEHILNQTMVRLYGKGRSFSNHIEKKKSKCDYKNFVSNLSEEELIKIESLVNAEIEKNHDVREEFIDRDEAEQKFNLNNLPEEAGEKIRLIKIGDYDTCPCSGVHVKNTSEIGKFKIVSSSFDNDVLRIRFKLIES
ncbi:MAG: hypothetical protein PHW27_13955 [Melioribacteraceae bacterium]|nr:hypothetical protein [Melioribacteraceae bacterium]MDD3559665.1 hypothetical protein [Melioribacteraceae bacterium]